MKLKIRFLLIIFLIAVRPETMADDNSPIVQEMGVKMKELLYANQYNAAQKMVLDYLEKENLTPVERLYGLYYYSDVLKLVGREKDAVKQLEIAEGLLPRIASPAKYYSLLSGGIAECYFNLEDFSQAKIYAERSIEISPEVSLRPGGHAINLTILGYVAYLESKHKVALDYYDKAITKYRQNNDACELPLIYMKMAKVFNAMKQPKKVESFIHLAESLSDSCNIESYKALTKQTLFDIHKNNEDYEQALLALQELNKLKEKFQIERQRQEMSAIEFQYATKLSQRENENLRSLNQKNQEIVARQRLALISALVAILVLLVSSILLVRLNRQKERARADIVALNAELEQKVNERTLNLELATEKIREDARILTFQNKQFVDFFNIISHNFRSPLANLTMLVQFIEDSSDEAERKNLIAHLNPVVNNLTSTCNELLESMEVINDKDIENTENDLASCFEKVKEGLMIEINNTAANIHIDFSHAPVVSCPPKYLESILQNLLSNALKYRSPDRVPEISLKSIKEPWGTVLSVRDNGLGIDLEKHGDDMFKIRKVFHHHPDAKGFGLFLTKTQIEATGGKIWAESKPDVGTAFFVEFRN